MSIDIDRLGCGSEYWTAKTARLWDAQPRQVTLFYREAAADIAECLPQVRPHRVAAIRAFVEHVLYSASYNLSDDGRAWRGAMTAPCAPPAEAIQAPAPVSAGVCAGTLF
jgi:hypothetical protein